MLLVRARGVNLTCIQALLIIAKIIRIYNYLNVSWDLEKIIKMFNVFIYMIILYNIQRVAFEIVCFVMFYLFTIFYIFVLESDQVSKYN